MTTLKIGEKAGLGCPICGKPAEMKRCKGEPASFFWACPVCESRGFFPEPVFRELDRQKKISFR